MFVRKVGKVGKVGPSLNADPLPPSVYLDSSIGLFYYNENPRLFSGEGGEGGRPEANSRLLVGGGEVPRQNPGFLPKSVR